MSIIYIYTPQISSNYCLFSQCAFPHVAATNIGKTSVASALTFIDSAPLLIFPHDMASSGLAPASDPSNSWPVLTYTA